MAVALHPPPSTASGSARSAEPVVRGQPLHLHLHEHFRLAPQVWDQPASTCLSCLTARSGGCTHAPEVLDLGIAETAGVLKKEKMWIVQGMQLITAAGVGAWAPLGHPDLLWQR